jgi:hypothetical protein
MISIKKINNEIVKPLKLPKIDENKIKGCNLFPNIYSNIFLLAKKMSGKTTVINKILKCSLNKLSKVYIFCSTVYKDSSYIEIIKMLDRKGIEHHEFTSIIENGVNNLENIIIDLQNHEKMEIEEPKPKIKFIKCDSSSDEEDEYEYKPKKIAPEVIFLFDDISNELHLPIISTVLKKNRHYKSKCIISSQYMNDLKPASIQQLDYVLIFGGQPTEKLNILHKQIDLSSPLNIFLEIYHNATSEKYNFLYVDVRKEKYRKNFNIEYNLEK